MDHHLILVTILSGKAHLGVIEG